MRERERESDVVSMGKLIGDTVISLIRYCLNIIIGNNRKVCSC